MKNLIGIFITVFCLNVSGQTVLFQNNEHVIWYKASGSKLMIGVEDLNDEDNTISYKYSGLKERATPWKYELLGNNWGGQYDAAIIEIDRNQNGKGDAGIDIDFCGEEKELNISHFLTDNFISIRNRIPLYMSSRKDETGVVINGKFANSSYQSKAHPIWTFDIPLAEILNTETFQTWVRVFVCRRHCAKDKYENPTYNKTFIYPEQEYSNQIFKSFVIDFTKIENDEIKAMVQKYKTEADNQKKLVTQATTDRKTKSAKAIATATTKQPEYDGCYLKLATSKFVELKTIQLEKGGYCEETKMNMQLPTWQTMERNPISFIRKSKFDIFSDVIQISKTAFKNLVFVGSTFPETFIQNLKIYPLYIHALEPQGKGRLYPMNMSYQFTNEEMERCEVLRFADKPLEYKRSTLAGSAFNLNTTEPLAPGLYIVWGENEWNAYVFEITN